jgi:hypothetical protein
MRLLDRSLGLMEGDGGNYVRRAWECQNGCELKRNRPEPQPKNDRAVRMNLV